MSVTCMTRTSDARLNSSSILQIYLQAVYQKSALCLPCYQLQYHAELSAEYLQTSV